MYILMNINECDTFHASLYLFRSIWHYFVVKNNIHLPVISIVDEIHEYSEVSEMIANAFRMVIGYHLCLTSFTRPTPKALKTELDMEKGFKITYLIGNSLPLHLKRVQFTLLIALKWFLILLASFPMKIRRMHAVYKIYVTVVLTFLQRSSRIHMFFFYDSPKGKKIEWCNSRSNIARLGDALLVTDS